VDIRILSMSKFSPKIRQSARVNRAFNRNLIYMLETLANACSQGFLGFYTEGSQINSRNVQNPAYIFDSI
jgi:hypothetical protein